jgi:hypothetical protein
MATFHEYIILKEIADYVSTTYDTGHHYGTSSIPPLQIIESRSIDQLSEFAMGNIIKYTSRYGKKGGHNRADLLKIAHYTLIALYANEKL